MKTNTPFINSFIHEIRQARKAESQYLKTGELKFLDNAIYILENILSHPDFETVDNNLQLVARNDSANMHLRRYWTSSNLAGPGTLLLGKTGW